MTISHDEQVKCVARELKLRKQCYPRWVARGNMTQEKADREIACMEAVLETLQKNDPKQVSLLGELNL